MESERKGKRKLEEEEEDEPMRVRKCEQEVAESNVCYEPQNTCFTDPLLSQYQFKSTLHLPASTWPASLLPCHCVLV